MTNREYLVQHPEEMSKMLKMAHEYAELEFGYHCRMTMAEEELLEKWLDAEHDKNAELRRRTSYIMNIALVMHGMEGVSEDAVQNIANEVAAFLKEHLALRTFDIDDITPGKIQCFEI